MYESSERDDLDHQQPTRMMASVSSQATDAEAENRPPRTEAADQSRVLRLLELHSAEREATAARVANLFPRPETTEWNVREISYDRTRRARVRDGS